MLAMSVTASDGSGVGAVATVGCGVVAEHAQTSNNERGHHQRRFTPSLRAPPDGPQCCFKLRPLVSASATFTESLADLGSFVLLT